MSDETIIALLTLLVIVCEFGYRVGQDIQRKRDEEDTKK